MSWLRLRGPTPPPSIDSCALASVDIFIETVGGRFGLAPLAEYLRTNTLGSLRAFARLIGQESFWRSWGHLLHSVRTGELAFRKAYGPAP